MLRVCLLVVFATMSMGISSDCGGKPNTLPVYTDAPKLIRTAANGKLYQTYSNDPPLNILHVYGTPYEMGFAHGTLLKQNVTWLFTNFYEWVDAQIAQALNVLPKSWVKVLEEDGVPALLDLNYAIVEEYVEDWFRQEMQGLADALGVSYMEVARVHMFPEIIKASCTMVGAWGTATTNSGLVQLRALDWNTNGPFNAVPTVIVYHPSNLGHSFSILSWSGFIGALTGYSSAPVGVCEKVWLNFKGESSRIGIPWHFTLRDILQFDANSDEAVTRLQNDHRTCSIFVGVGNPDTKFKVVEYAHPSITVWNNTNFPTYENHPHIPDVLYVDKHTQPSTHACLSSVLTQGNGNITAKYLFSDVIGYHQTGEMHAAIYDFPNDKIYVSTASINTGNLTHNTAIPAYDRRFTQLDMKALFAEKL